MRDNLPLRGDGHRTACSGMLDDPEGLAVNLTLYQVYDGAPEELRPTSETYRFFRFRTPLIA